MLKFLKSLRKKLTFFLCLGTVAYPSQVQALGYEQGIHSIHAFESSIDAFEKEGFPLTDKQAMPRVVDLVIESYNLMYYLNVDRFPCPIKDKLLNDISRARRPLFDEFCLKYSRKWAFERYINKFEDMTPAQRTRFITYTITTAVGEALVLEFINDIAGLGDLDDIGAKSRIGRWLGKTSGGRALFKKLRKLHQARRDMQHMLLGYGLPANKVRELDYQLAKTGFRHAKTLRDYSQKPLKEIKKSIRSYAKRIEEHTNLIKDPEKYLTVYGKPNNWASFDAARKARQLEKWALEVQTFKQLKNVMEGILHARTT